MQDVIFNGSAKRKPVSRASVELIFDNSLGKATGQWSSYAEISIKRVLLRDGDSSYHINNQHVRRKDITDIFLGTGLGTRAYAIIEQGMVSRIIEASPEELRMFLEEAAGISRYRDRRRETGLRIADTQNNLLRVNDILQELTKQLVHLTEQAAIAAQYRELESRRDTAQQLLWLINRQEAKTRQERFTQAVEKTRNELEAETTHLRELESRLEITRSESFTQADALHARQGELYAANAEIARLQQQIAHLNDQRTRLMQQVTHNEQQIRLQHTQLQEAQSLLEDWQQKLQEASIRANDWENRMDAGVRHLPQAEDAARNAHEYHNKMQLEHTVTQQQLQLANTQREHIQRNMQQLEVRRSRLLLELDNLPPVDDEALAQTQDRFVEMERECEVQRQQLAQLQAQLPEANATRHERRIAMQDLERKLSRMEAKLSALQQLQEQGDHDNNLKQWLIRHQLHQLPQLWQSIRIEPGWEDALEAVLRERLNALVLPHLDITLWSEPPPARLTVFTAGSVHDFMARPDMELTPLRQFVHFLDTQATCVVTDWLAGVYATETLAQGLESRERLPVGSWLVTPQGHLIGTHSVLFHAPDSQVHGILARQREIDHLLETIQQLIPLLHHSRHQAELAEDTYQATENRITLLRTMASELQQRQHETQVKILKLTQASERHRERTEQITLELQELAEQSATEKYQYQEIAEHMEILHENIIARQEEAEQARLQAVARESVLCQQREHSQNMQHELQEARFLVKTCTGKIADLKDNLTQIELTLAQLEPLLVQNHAELGQIDDSARKRQLQEALQQQQAQERALADARNTLEQITHKLTQQEQERLSCEQKLHPLREKLGEWSLKEQEARLQYEQWAGQLQKTDESALLSLLENSKHKPSGLQNELDRLNNDITGLGAVNLAALGELQAAQERKTYLDTQAKDLNDAIDTLKEAIRRIDKESRGLLMSTYDEVNRHLAEMFPILFGGGEARLVLTGEEILDSGVQVIAQPPGKKNTSIHLLSGGEKALTAIALVFSMFQLNPAPFCLLDEVDAPLDDTNTERLCKLIRKMTEHTQFIFISHNKITMELAQQLVGITMQERGVSHVVTVDIEKALRLRDDSTMAA